MLFHVALGILAFTLAAASDWLETRYVQAVNRATMAGEREAEERAARCSVAMWLVGVVGLVAVVEYGWWLLLPEGAGLYFGTRLALQRRDVA